MSNNILVNNVIWTECVLREELKEFQWQIKKEDRVLNAKLQNTIKKRWYDAPIYLWHEHDNLILDGHQRLIALNALADKWFLLPDDKVPVVYIVAETEKEAKEKVLEYNSKYAEFDMSALDDRSEGLDLEDINIDGFDTDWDDEKEEKEDEMPIMTAIPPIIQHGDIFQLWDHILMCGDSTLPSDVEKLMGGKKADMVWTDPPYNVWYKGHQETTKDSIMNDKMSKDSFKIFLQDAFKNLVQHTKMWAGIYIRHNHKEQIAFEQAINDSNMEIKHQIVWNKLSLWLGAGDYRPKHELCFYTCIKGQKATFYWDRSNSTVIDFRKEKDDKKILSLIKRVRIAETEGKTTIFSVKRDNVNEYVHPTQKPVELCQLSLLNNSKQDDIVLDLFLWSGCCLIACEKHNRICHGMELDPKFMETIIRRYYDYTDGQKEIKCLNRKIDISTIFA